MPEPISPSPKNAILVVFHRVQPLRQKLPLNKRTDFRLHHHQNRVTQPASKSLELDLHHISVGETYSVPEGQGMSSEELNVVMFEVAEAMTHLLLAGPDIL